MGLAYNVYLNSKRIYGCRTCKTHLADHDEIISRVSPSWQYDCESYFNKADSHCRTSVASMAKHTSSTASSITSRVRPLSAT